VPATMIRRATDGRQTHDIRRAPGVEKGIGRVLPPPPDPVMPEAKTSKASIQTEDTLSKTITLSTEESSKLAHIGNNLDPK
jgi:hypothetical protein